MMKFFLPFSMLLFLLNPTIFMIMMIMLTFLFLKPSGLVMSDYSNFLGVDEVVFWLVIMTIMVSAVTYMYSVGQMKFYILMVLIMASFGFMTNNLLFFFLTFEFSLVPMLILMVGWGYQPERFKATYFLTVFTIMSSVPFFSGLIWLEMLGGVSMSMLPNSLDYSWVMFLFMIVFFIKSPLYLMHIWLPKAHVESPTSGSVLLAAIYLKMGSYGLMRVGPMCFNPAMLSYVLGVSLMGGLFMSMSMLCHPDLKFSVAVSSVSHMSLGTFLIISQTNIGLSASMVLNIGHGYISSLLFLLVGEMSKVSNSRSFLLNAKITKSSRLFVGVLVMGLLANSGVPPFLSFYSELSLVTYLEGFSNFMLCFWILTSLFMVFQSLLLILVVHDQYSYSYSNLFSLKFFMGCFYLLVNMTLMSPWPCQI